MVSIEIPQCLKITPFGTHSANIFKIKVTEKKCQYIWRRQKKSTIKSFYTHLDYINTIFNNSDQKKWKRNKIKLLILFWVYECMYECWVPWWGAHGLARLQNFDVNWKLVVCFAEKNTWKDYFPSELHDFHIFLSFIFQSLQ